MGHHRHQHNHHHMRASASIHGVLAPQSGDVAGADQSGEPTNGIALPSTEGSASLRYKRTERVGLVIQTQDGDTVRLRFRTSERLKAEIANGTDGDGSEVSLSARTNSKISMSIKGDLSAEELTAIQDTFNQATALADQFFAGGLSDAFAGAQALNIDGEQLARVSFKASLKQHLTYTSRGYAPALPVEAPPEGEAPVGEVPGGDMPGGENPVGEVPAGEAPAGEAPVDGPPVEGGLPEEGSFPDTALPDLAATEVAVGEPEGVPASAEGEGTDALEGPAEESPSLADPAQIIGDFLSRLAEALGSNPEGEGTGMLDVSLKIRIFQSALVTLSETQPVEEPGLPDLVPETLEAAADLQQPPLDAVA